MRTPLLSLVLALAAIFSTHAAEPFEIKDGDRVLFLGDTLLEREGTYGYLETRMAEQFPDRKFTVRNLAFSADTPLGWSRASFDPAAKGFERLKEQLALVQPTVVFLGYGMAASLQEMTDRSQDWTLNRDTARYGAEPMSAGRFKRELAQLMDAIVEGNRKPDTGYRKGEDGDADASKQNLSGIRYPVSGFRFVLLSPIRHEDLRATRPGLPDPTEHNKLLEQYSKAIEELAKERGARFVSLNFPLIYHLTPEQIATNMGGPNPILLTDNGIHLNEVGYVGMLRQMCEALSWGSYLGKGVALGEPISTPPGPKFTQEDIAASLKWHERKEALRAAIIRKNALFFHRWRPANETYLFGFRKREQGQNAVEIPKFDPLIEAAEAEIEKLKHAPKGASVMPSEDGATADIHGGVSPELPAVSAEHRSVSGEHRSVSDEHRSVSGEHRSVSDEHRSVSGEHRSVSGEHRSVSDEHRSVSDEHRSVFDEHRSVFDEHTAASAQQKADFQPQTPVFTSAGQLYAANDTPAIGNQPPVTSHQSPVTSPDPARQTPAETPDLSKLPASPSTLPLPTFTLADGLEISLWAENPLLAKPTEMNWDAQGRLWVASSALYPMIAPGQAADDKILILEDPGHTGKGTKSTVFVDGLLLPTGVAPVLVEDRKADTGNRKGEDGDADASKQNLSGIRSPVSGIARWACYVGQSTELLYFEDTQGTGKADKKRIVLSGFGTEDTHHIVHTLRWGPDGRLYFNQSVYIHTHMETPWGVVRLNSGGVFAYDPRTERVEVVTKGLWNTWGHAWDQWGQSFLSDGAGFSGISWAFPGAVFNPSEGSRRQMPSISPGSYPKFAGLELIYSPHFPAEWQGTAVTCDFRAHKIVHFKINDLGLEQSAKSGYVTDQLPVLAQTSDATFRPIDVKLGPDGAIYIADWSNPIINHGEVDFRDPRRDHEHGRIWRLSMKGGAAVKWESLVGKNKEELISARRSKSQWALEQATHLLIYRPHTEAERQASRDSLLVQMLTDPAAQFEVPALLILNTRPRIRIGAMRALARLPKIESASLILDAAINAPKDDPFYEFAAWLSINDVAEVWTEAVLAGKWKIEGREKQLEFALDALDAARSGPVIAALLKERPITRDGAGPWIELIGKGGGKAELEQLFERVAKGDFEPPAFVRAINALADAARLRNLRPEGNLASIRMCLVDPHAEIASAAARLAGQWHLSEVVPYIVNLAQHPDEGPRAAAIEGLRNVGGAKAVDGLLSLTRSRRPEVRPAALAALAQLKPAAAISEIPTVLGAIQSEPELLATWRGIFQSKEAADTLAKNFPADLPKPVITAALHAARELGRKGERLVAKLAPLAGESLANFVPADFADLAARAKKDGDPVAGEALYRRMASACTTCHAIGGAGGKLGPDLTSIGASAPADYIIESVLNPAAKVKEGYHAFSFAMKDGTEAIGIPTRETPQEQFIRTIAGEQGLPKANIVSKKIAEGGASLMPAGLTAAWSDRERLNLYAFLMELGRPGPFDASKNNVARVWQLTDSGKVDGALKVEAAASTPSIPSTYAYTLVDGRLTKDLLTEKLAILQPKNTAVHLTARFQAASAGKAKLNLTGIRKAWLDGQPLAIASEPSPSVELTAGAHTFTVEVDAKSPPEVLRLESPAANFLGD